MLQCLVQNRTLLAPRLALWAPLGCAAQDLACYFDSLPSATAFTIDERSGVLRRREGEGEGEGFLSPRRPRKEQPSEEQPLPSGDPDAAWIGRLNRGLFDEGEQRRIRAYRRRRRNGGLHKLSLDASYFQRFQESELLERVERRFTRHGRFWLFSQILHFLTRPGARLDAALDAARSSLGLRAPYLSLHVHTYSSLSHSLVLCPPFSPCTLWKPTPKEAWNRPLRRFAWATRARTAATAETSATTCP